VLLLELYLHTFTIAYFYLSFSSLGIELGLLVVFDLARDRIHTASLTKGLIQQVTRLNVLAGSQHVLTRRGVHSLQGLQEQPDSRALKLPRLAATQIAG
jgi:hypothetical protein